MRIHQIIVESAEPLEEGPLLNKIGSGIGKAVGAAAKGVGSVAGGIVGMGKAIRKGYQAGRDTVGGAGDDPETTDGGTTSQSKPTANTATQGQTSAPAANTAAPAQAEPVAAPAAKAAPKSAFGKLSAAANGEAPAQSPAPAAAPTAGKQRIEPTLDNPAQNPKADSAYAQAQKAVSGLAPEQKKEIMTMLQADPKVKAAMTAKPVAKPAAPAAKPANTMANAPVSKTNKAKPAAPAPAAPTGKPAMTKTGTVRQKQLTPAGFGQMVGGLTKKG